MVYTDKKTADAHDYMYDKTLYQWVLTRPFQPFITHPSVTRLKDISLSAIPTRYKHEHHNRRMDSRFIHSIGVMHLAGLLSDQEELKAHYEPLSIAGLYHDSGSPPFSHAAEPFMQKMLGIEHDEHARRWLEDVEDLLEMYGTSVSEVHDFVSGRDTLGNVIAGTLDMDNLDNSLRYGACLGVLREGIYDPRFIAKNIVLKNNKPFFKNGLEHQLKKWDVCRQEVYNEVYSTSNLFPSALLTKALSTLYEHGELLEEFFDLTETRATAYLTCHPKTKRILGLLEKRVKPRNTFTFDFEHPVGPTEVNTLEQSMCDALNIREENMFGTYIHSNRNKIVHIPFEDGSLHKPLTQLPVNRIILYTTQQHTRII